MAVWVSPVGRVSYPRVWEPEQILGQGEPKFQITLLIPKNEPKLAEMREVAKQVMFKKWPNGSPPNFQSPFLDGDTLNTPETHGKIVVRMRAKEDRKPQIVGPDKRPITKESGLFYSGCHARVSYSCYAWTFGSKNGVGFGFNNVQKIRDDEAFDNRTQADQDFDAVEEVEDPFATDDIPF